ncbi:alpha/beta fold hydrolase [Acidisoma sp. L85]|uniref:alpha/beta fold hydrolase n=1 Tax=Acidisoma sp. L85 TaxID=1641850 RepID=UPI00131A9A09|nr:alpha/beta hydrolase [Acidisoma sp. L85]
MGIEPSFDEHLVPREQGEVYARDYAGAAPAFVLLHGFPDNLHIYDQLVPHLVAAGRRVVTFDFLGYGASDKPAGNRYGFKQQLGDLEAVVEALGIDKIVPVAHDAGGPAAINFAIDHPDRVASLCILNTFYAAAPSLRLPELIELFATPGLKALADAILQSPEQFAWLLRFQQRIFLETLPEEHKAAFEAFLAPIINNNFNFGRAAGSGPASAQMTAQIFEEVARNTLRLAEMEALDIPVKLIWGGADLALNTGVADDFKSHFKHASLSVLPAGHWLQVDMPEAVAREMLS